MEEVQREPLMKKIAQRSTIIRGTENNLGQKEEQRI